MHIFETSLIVQWLRLHASSAGGMGSIPGWRSTHRAWGGGQKREREREREREMHIFVEYNLVIFLLKYIFHVLCCA